MSLACAILVLTGEQAPVASTAPAGALWTDRIDAINGGPDYSWRLGDASGSTMAARDGGVDGTWINTGNIVFETGPLVTDSNGGKSVVLGALASTPGHGTIPVNASTGIAIAGEHTFHVRCQLDMVVAKMQVLNTDEDGLKAEGTFAYEFVADGAGGMKPRMYTWREGDAVVVYVGAELGTVPVGDAFGATFLREDGALRCRINGVEIAMTLSGGTPPASWAAVPSGKTLRLGSWYTGIVPFDGALAELCLWNDYIMTPEQTATLNVPASIVYLKDATIGEVLEGATTTVDLQSLASPFAGITPSIVAQGGRGSASIDGLIVEYAADADELGADSFTMKVTKGGIDSRTATVSLTVGNPPDAAGLAYLGRAVGDITVNGSAANFKLTGNSVATCQGYFFYAEKSGSVTHFITQWRAKGGGVYSDGDGGTYTIQIRKANPSTKMPIDGAGNLICQFTGYNANGSDGTSISHWEKTAFSSSGTLVQGEPYFICAINTHGSPGANYVSWNIQGQYVEASGDEPPPGGWVPVTLPNGQLMYPYSCIKRYDSASVTANRVGSFKGGLVYSDGTITGAGGLGQIDSSSSEASERIEGSTQLRQRFRPFSGQGFQSNGIWAHLQRRDGSTGNLKIRLESGPASLTSGNGTLIEEIVVPHTAIYNIGARNGYNPSTDKVPWVWLPFSTTRTFNAGTIYSIRYYVTDSLKVRVNASTRGEGIGIYGLDTFTDFGAYEAAGGGVLGGWRFSMGTQKSTDSGGTWAWTNGASPQRRTIPLLLRTV